MVKVVADVDSAVLNRFMSAERGPVLSLIRTVQNETYVRADDWLSRLGAVDTGNLRGSRIKTPIVTSGKKIVAGVEYTADYAMYVHEGTRPHVIVPRRARVLAWNPRGGGGTIFAQRVNHPGSKAKPWLRSAASEVARANNFIETDK